MKHLILLRGVPGAGKTTAASLFLGHLIDATCLVAADNYMVDENGNYNYDQTRLAECHKLCQDKVKYYLNCGIERVVVHNTFCADWEMDVYYKIAEEVGDCRVHTMIVENRHGSKNIHDVPDDKIEMMKTKLMDNIKL